MAAAVMALMLGVITGRLLHFSKKPRTGSVQRRKELMPHQQFQAGDAACG